MKVSANKSCAGCKVGIQLRVEEDGKVLLKGITDTSIFKDTPGLEIGQELLAINDVWVRGESAADIAKMLGDIEKTVKLKMQTPTSFTLAMHPQHVDTDGGTGTTKLLYKKEENAAGLGYLEAAGVPVEESTEILREIVGDWYQEVRKFLQADHDITRVMQKYRGEQAVRNFVSDAVGFGGESSHERRTMNHVNLYNVLQANMNLLATNAALNANALLNPRGITVRICYSALDFDRDFKGRVLLPIGLDFEVRKKV